MALLQGLLFLLFGIGLLSIVFQRVRGGRLPAGSNWLRGRLEFAKDEQALRYWLVFVLYAAGGLWLVFFSLKLLLGLAEPLPLN